MAGPVGLPADMPLLGLTASCGTVVISTGTVVGGQLALSRLTGGAFSCHLLTPSDHQLLEVHAPTL